MSITAALLGSLTLVLAQHVPVQGHGQGSKDCHFPFKYKGVSYNECTNADYGNRFWCAYGPEWVSGPWKDCVDKDLLRNPHPDGTKACASSFTYNKQSYTGCTSVDSPSGTPWCSLDSTFIGKWRYCATDCHFPFKYKGVSYNECTTADYGNRFWCAYGPEWVSGPWKDCVDKDLLRNPHPDRTKACASSFTYNKQSYTGCTSVDSPSGTPWCSLDSTFKGKWRYCDPPAPPPAPVPIPICDCPSVSCPAAPACPSTVANKIRWGRRLFFHIDYDTRDTVEACAEWCEQRVECLAITYNKDNKRCFIYDSNYEDKPDPTSNTWAAWLKN